ncbi:CaiB/BaiF CoA transferase family protein [Roseovarius mucosus]|uniref:CaiB/BaiF CoA transferase family protein n=1 Tax=Roseovarius mucosus TaxID=215743 RepID=UPI003F721499
MADLLRGIRVLDLTNVLAGPFCCFQLAQLGADVIKIERPGSGDLARQLGADSDLNAANMGASFIAQNAGKRSVTLDLKHQRGRDVFLRLCDTADVVVENFRPGVMDRLGLGASVLTARDPRLVYCAISGFGQDGPLAQNPAYDQIIQGLSGVMSVTGDETTAPLRVGYPICDTVGGMTAAFAITAALAGRASSGRGEVIDVSMLEATLATMGWPVSNWLVAQVAPQAFGNQNMTAAPSGTFRTAAGLLNIAANKHEQFLSLCALLDRPDLAHDPRFDMRENRKRHRAALNAEIEASLKARPARDWASLLNRHGVPAGEVLDLPDALEQPQIAARNVKRSFDGMAGRPAVTVLRAGFRLAGGDPDPRTPPPQLGADTESILREIGLEAEELTAMQQEGVI